MKIKEMIERVIKEDDKEKMYKLNDMLNDLICDLKNRDYKLYKEYKICLYELAYGRVILEEKAKEIVNDMKPYREYWSIEQIKDILEDNSLKYNVVDFYLVANSLYNDYCDVFGNEDTNIYIKMACKWIDDKDAVEDKVYYYFMNIPKKD